MDPKALVSLGRALIVSALVFTVGGAVGFFYILTGSATGDSGPIGGISAQEKVKTLLELGPPLLVATGVVLGVGVYCLAASRTGPAAQLPEAD